MARRLPTPIEAFKLKVNSFALQFEYLAVQERRDIVDTLLQDIEKLYTNDGVFPDDLTQIPLQKAVNNVQIATYHMTLDNPASIEKTHRNITLLSNML
jgi:hypothetical protein